MATAVQPAVKIGSVDIQFDKTFDQQKANQLVQQLQATISGINKLAQQVATLQAASGGTTTVPAHVLATTTGLESDHTVTGLTPGQVLIAIADDNAAFGRLDFSQMNQVDPATFDAPTEGQVLAFHDGYYSMVDPASSGIDVQPPATTSLLFWNEEAQAYAWANPGAGLELAAGELLVTVPVTYTGTAIVNFGTGAYEASVAITGQAGILSVSATAASVTCADDSAWVEQMHAWVTNIVPGLGFTVIVKPQLGKAVGSYTVNWLWE